MKTSRPSLLAASLCLSFAGCVTVDPNAAPEREPADKAPVFASHTKDLLERAWTPRFQASAVLIADDVWIEGPADLMQHIAVTQDAEVLDFATWTTKDGLRQETSVKPGMAGREVRAQLDGWTIVAMQKLRILQRPGDAPLVVRATGAAKLIPVDGEPEQRGQQLVFRGEHTR